MQYYPAIRKKEILPFVTSVNLKDIMASEINQKEIYDFTYVEFLKADIKNAVEQWLPEAQEQGSGGKYWSKNTIFIYMINWACKI